MSTQKESNENLLAVLKEWQTIEDASIKSTSEIIGKSDNPLIHLVMEIIRHDSAMHRRVQQLIIDHFEKKAVSLNPDELAVFWTLVEDHDDMEKKTIALAEKALAESKSPLVQYLVGYLLEDEKKHDNLLETMAKIKNGMYPYGGF